MIFLDNNSTTPIGKNVLVAMKPYLEEEYGNPHSIFHLMGKNAKKALENSRGIIAELFDVERDNVVFTSGATEANNLAIQGAIKKSIQENSSRKKIFCSAIEHKCVLDCVKGAVSHGLKPEIIPVNSDGQLDLDFLKQNIDGDTLFVSVMSTNNETGIQVDLSEVTKICQEFGVIFHSDFSQNLFTDDSLSLIEQGIDAISISGHKIYAPKGIGALITKDAPLMKFSPINYGGLQEGEIRSGTTPVFLAVGLSIALQDLVTNKKAYIEDLRHKKINLFNKLSERISNIEVNGSINQGHPGTLNLCFPDIEADMLCSYLGSKVAISTAAACSGVDFEYSHVLKAMGYSTMHSKSSVRLCVGLQTSYKDLEKASTFIENAIMTLRKEEPMPKERNLDLPSLNEENTIVYCSECNEPIDPKRLKIMPNAKICVACKTGNESNKNSGTEFPVVPERLSGKCPRCKQGIAVVYATREKNFFVGCSRYPKCRWSSEM